MLCNTVPNIVFGLSAIASYLLAVNYSIRTVNSSDPIFYPISFWSRPYHRGDEYLLWMQPHRCYKLGWASDRLNSMATYGQCVDIFTRDDCFGGMFRIDANLSRCIQNLGECDMNDRVSSVRICPRCRNNCYYHAGDETGVLSEDGDEEVCLCHCNCPVPGVCASEPVE